MGESGSNPNPEKGRPFDSPSPSADKTPERPQILLIEDNAADVFLVRAAIRAAGIDADLKVVQDGERAIELFDLADKDPANPCPVLVILDINLPKKQGGDVLRHLRNSHRCRDLPVIAVSSSQALEDRARMAALGANGYFHKPSVYADFMKLGDMVRQLLRR